MDQALDREKPADEAEAALWSAFKTDNSLAAREQLFARHANFARNIARRLHRESSRGDLELADLYHYAFTGLLEALDRFDPAQGVPFRAFAPHRIVGSVRDGIVRASELREQISWHHRIRRERLRSLSTTNTGQMNSSDAMQKLAELAVGLALGFMLEGTGMCAPGDEEQEAMRPNTGGAYDSLAWKETVEQLHEELSGLSEREQMILRQHYLNGVPFEHLAMLLGVTKGRVSQIHKASLLHLRRRMSERGHFRLER